MIHIEDYISGFLLKNKYCAISGLGTLELKRDPAMVRPKEGQLTPPTYNITFLPIGVIDDALAAYIANHENVSISKASNDIKTFSQDVKQELRHTGKYEIANVGHFTYKNDTIQFFQDETLNLERDPIQLYQDKRDTRQEEGETLADAKSFKDLHFTHAESGEGKPKMGTILKYLLGLLLLIGLMAAAYFTYKYYEDNKETVETTEDVPAATFEEFEEPIVTDTTVVAVTDTTITDIGETVTAAADEYKIGVMNFSTQALAESKSKTLNSYGNKTSVMKQGESFLLVVFASQPANDTTALKDSLRRYFNPSGTPFIVK